MPRLDKHVARIGEMRNAYNIPAIRKIRKEETNLRTRIITVVMTRV
jgi:hypothetical protein